MIKVEVGIGGLRVLDYLSFEIRLSTVWCGLVLYGATSCGSICYGAMSCGFV